MEELEEFLATGGAPLKLTAEQLEAAGRRPTGQPSQAPSVKAVAAAAVTPVIGPGIMPGSVKLQTVDDPFVRWGQTNVAPQKQAGYHHVTVRLPLGDMTAGQMRVLADLAEAYGDGTMRLTVEQNVLFKWVKKESLAPFYERIAAAGLGAADANTLGDVVSCPGAESCRLAVTQSRGLGRGLTEYLSTRAGSRGDGAGRQGQHQDQRLPERLRPASHRRRSASRAACARWAARPCRSTSCWSAAAAPTTAPRTSARWCRRCRCTA